MAIPRSSSAAGEPDDQREAQAAAAFNLTVAHLAVGALDVADTWLGRSTTFGYDEREISLLRCRIDDLRSRAKAAAVQP